ncbi:unnamed protein product [Clonostachys byssicola]|uniref:Transcriptional activator of proteases prtT n=1 Tax=Clonostachys byssicola TaxID=160290 RepID=A0A9N9UFG4_9HYPO|nr:unnamed protein product [Clonostachys byssicola]
MSRPPLGSPRSVTTDGVGGDNQHLPRGDAPIRRRRRRVISCDSCRRLKCRCLVEDGHESCNRCRALQLNCSKSTDQSGSASNHSSFSNDLQVESRCASLLISNSSCLIEADPSLQIHLTRKLRRIEERMVQISSPRYPDFTPAPDVQSPATSSGHFSAAGTNVESRDGSQHVGLIDQNVASCPAEVIRKVSKVLNGGQRRTFDRSQDLLSIGLLDEQTASEVMQTFITQCRHSLFILEERDLASGRDLRATSPFLHAVCCLHGIKHSHFDGTPLHRQVYEAVRQMLGDAMLVTPLPIEEITGILLMAMYASSPTRGPEYIDSWLLSGHCAQQAMLSIHFSDISERIDSGLATSTDQRAVRTWAIICLVNLHWAAITGRPPTIPAAYLIQSQLLLNFEQATMRDGMLVSEVNLFKILHQNFESNDFLDNNGSSTSLCTWKEKWSYLFDLPTSGVLRMSHSIAWLLLTRRSLDVQRRNGDLSSFVNLATQASPFTPDCANSSCQETEVILYKWACSVLHDFLSLTSASYHGIPEFYLLSLGYSLLVLGKYDKIPDGLTPINVYDKLKSLEQKCEKSKRVSSAVEFALEKALSRVATLLDVSAEG